MKQFLGIGNALVDVLVQTEDEQILGQMNLPKGSMQLIDDERFARMQRAFAPLQCKRTTGGSACNTILALSHMGSEVGLIGRIGLDEQGRFFEDEFVRQGVQLHLIHDPSLATGTASTIITPDGQRTFGTYLGAAVSLCPEDLQPEWFGDYGYFYVEGYLVQNHDLIRTAVHTAHEAGLKVCIDMASYNIVEEEREFFNELLRETDIVFANEQEARAFTGSDDPEENLRALSQLCGIAVVKVGKKGVWVQRGEEKVLCPAREVPHVVDTTAAGDYFSAGFLHALASGASLMQCAQLGSLLAGHIIEVVGTSLPTETWNSIRCTWHDMQ